ncbi:MAG TPA: tetratricopeptide repeat protein [Holophagaceae bacterium]|nr:tetratricopeptide repeat protein [Holophagaceae bacterium]
MDPYAPYLKQAATLFAQGETLKAGQIWQAILKQQPAHVEAREGLLKVKATLELQKAFSAAVPPAPAPDPGPAPAAAAPAPPPLPEPVAVTPWPEPEPFTPPAPRAAAPEPPVHTLPEPEPAPAPEPEAAPVLVHSDDEIERLLREGCTLFDMGQTEDALRKWELLLAGAPHHRMARDYANGARRELGLPLLAEGAVPSAPVAASPAAATAPVADHGEDVDRLLREAVQLYDMGLPEEAIGKWEKALALEPHRTEVQRYLEQARAEHQEKASAPTAPPTPRPSAPTRPVVDQGPQVALRLKQAEHLMGMQRFDEAAFTYQQALDLDPANAAAQEGLRRARARDASGTSNTSGALPIPTETQPGTGTYGGITLVELETPAAKAAPVTPPATVPASLTKTLPPQREGLKIPSQLSGLEAQLEAYPILKEPKLWAGVAGGLLVVLSSCAFIQGQRKESARKEAVREAHAAAIAAVAKEAEAVDLTEAIHEVKEEAEQALGIDPLRAYFRAEFLLKLAPGDPAGSQLLVKARAGLPGGVTGATVAEFQKHLQDRNLDAAAKVLDALLREDPSNLELRSKGSHLHLALMRAYGQQQKWDEAREALLRARAMAPGDKSWQAKLRLLAYVKGLPKGAQREAWLAFVG